MSEIKIIGGKLPNIPWQNKPENCTAPVWRYTENPVINRNPLPNVARIFNSAVMPYKDGFIGVFRGEQRNGIPHIYLGRSIIRYWHSFARNNQKYEKQKSS